MIPEPAPDGIVFVLGTGTIISLLTAAVVYLRQIAQAATRLADK